MMPRGQFADMRIPDIDATLESISARRHADEARAPQMAIAVGAYPVHGSVAAHTASPHRGLFRNEAAIADRRRAGAPIFAIRRPRHRIVAGRANPSYKDISTPNLARDVRRRRRGPTGRRPDGGGASALPPRRTSLAFDIMPTRPTTPSGSK